MKKTYHINFYADNTTLGASAGANYVGEGERESDRIINAIHQWEEQYPITKYPNALFISMRTID